ncbi:uncharacterized protein LOC133362717 isoform X1 [Lethenteron reissneri]|uniref:uncharacterized protein LOC133362717 isoform X1 n=2 Tax=Lethenteron reissneri TaxID=7753 RepID=UPI002AB7B4AC|nr:uncharacterized protein LOC133362717 isoform X1 [Lethenteron reissneri]
MTSLSGQTEPAMKPVLISLFVFLLLDAALAVKLQLTLPKSLSVREGENVTLPCSFSPPATHLDHVVVQWFTMPRRYAENVTSGDMTLIYFSGDETADDSSVAKSAGDVLAGDCSVGIPNFPGSLGPVALCRVDCRRCDAAGNAAVQAELLLQLQDVTAAAPRRPHGGALSEATAAPPGETPPHRAGLLVAGVLAPVAVVVYVVSVCKGNNTRRRRRRRRRRRPSGPGQPDRPAPPDSGAGNAERA